MKHLLLISILTFLMQDQINASCFIEPETQSTIETTTPFTTTPIFWFTSTVPLHHTTQAPQITTTYFIVTTTMLPTTTHAISSCSISDNTIGMCSSCHVRAVVSSANSKSDCCNNCMQAYPACTVFVYSYQYHECYQYGRIKWANLTFIPDNNYAIGRVL